MSDISLLSRLRQARAGRFSHVGQPLTLSGGALLSLGVLALLEDFAARAHWINEVKFPPAGEILLETGHLLHQGQLLTPLADTLSHWLMALLIAIALGFALGVAIGTQRWLSFWLTPLIEFIRPVPSTALIPLVILSIGADAAGAVFLTVFGTLWQVLPLFIDGSRRLDPMALDVARAYRLPRLTFFLYIRLPTLWATLKTAIRIGGAAALVLCISMEYLAGINGIGKEVSVAYSGENYLRMYACVVVTLLLSVGMNLALSLWRAKGQSGAS
ncbi:Nitrate ABC transport permease (plasmid) [Sodalis praecaptivus]|uniref:Nitrate ABC transport permease n=1 Tax=Sodalis praecaptivus TaxID=1239307 RepID=W0HZ11_9GAMM|nr:ABC transporter permease subunit [Sodalis praecaptivus]AHF79091.1 Nitrate ABC transport permease [Sodalis praecaptivus]